MHSYTEPKAQDDFPPPCLENLGKAINPVRQQWLTMIASKAFFDSHMASNAEDRSAAANFLQTTMIDENPQLSWELLP